MNKLKITKEDQLKNKANFIDEEGNLYLVRCMACHAELTELKNQIGRENWAPAVANGICAWCGWSDEQL